MKRRKTERRRTVAPLLAFIVAAVLPTAAPGSLFAAGQRSTDAAAAGPLVITSTWAVQHPGWELRNDNIVAPLLLDKYNIKMEWVAIIPHAEAREKLTLMFASGDYPDLLGNHNQLPLYNQLGMDGYLQDVTPLLPKVPNYRRMYTDFQWKLTFESRRASNNKLYLLPQFRPWAVTAGIIYRKDTFDRLGLREAATVDGLVANLRAIKKAQPNSIPWGNKWGLGQIMGPLLEAYQVTAGLHLDPYTNELVPYGGTTDKMRDVIKVLHTLYREELIDREYATVTDTQFEDKIRQDRIHLVAASFVGWLNKHNIINRPANPDADWVVADMAPTATGRLTYDPVVNGQPWGPSFTDKLTGERLDRYLEFVNWLCTDEGVVFDNSGIEGVTYTVVGGAKQFVDTIDASNPDKIKPAALGIINWASWSWDGITANYGTDAPLTYHKRISADPAFKPFRRSYSFLFESDMERDQFQSLQTIINDTYNQFLHKFVMGELNPNNNTDWNAYLDAMRRAGLDRFIELSVARYKKDYQQ